MNMTAKEEWKSLFTGLVRDWKKEPTLIALAIFATLEFGLFLYFQYRVIIMDEHLFIRLGCMFVTALFLFGPFMAHEGTLYLLCHIQQLFHMVIVRPAVWVIYKLVH